MKRRAIGMALAILVAFSSMVLASGCLWAPELDDVRKDLQRQLPGVSFNKEFAVSLGPVLMGLVRLVTRLAPETEDARVYLDDMKQVKVAIYEADNYPTHVQVRMPKRLENLLEDNGWEIAVKVSEAGENVWLLYKGDENSIEEIYVVVLSPDELVMVRARGKLDRLVAKVLKEDVDIDHRLKV